MVRIRRIGILMAALAVVIISAAACSPGGVLSGDMMWAPHRTQDTGPEVTQSALAAIAEGEQTGVINLTEAELSSLLRAALVKGEDEGLLRDVQIWLEPDTLYIKLLLRQGIVPFVPTDTALNLEGTVRVEDGRLHFGINRAGVGVIAVLSRPVLAALEEELGLALNELVRRRTPLDVTLSTGQITVTLP